jgi:streptomycin 6-kinase
VVCRAIALEGVRLLEWTLASTCLSAAWTLEDGEEPELDLAVAKKAAEARRLEV